jgi:type II secretory pathway component PulF
MNSLLPLMPADIMDYFPEFLSWQWWLMLVIAGGLIGFWLWYRRRQV